MSFFTPDNGSGGGFAAYASVNPWTQNPTPASLASDPFSSYDHPIRMDSLSDENQPALSSVFGASNSNSELNLQMSSSSATTPGPPSTFTFTHPRAPQPDSSDPLSLLEARLDNFEASQPQKMDEEGPKSHWQDQQQQSAPHPQPFISPFQATYGHNDSNMIEPQQHSQGNAIPGGLSHQTVFGQPQSVQSDRASNAYGGAQTQPVLTPWWTPGFVGLGLGASAYSLQGATFAPNINPSNGYPPLGMTANPPGVFDMINLAVQIGPACYGAAHRLFSAASQVHAANAQAHAANAQAHAAAADFIATLPYAIQCHQPQTQTQTQPLSSPSSNSEPPFTFNALDEQSSFWNTAQATADEFPAPPLRPVMGFQNQDVRNGNSAFATAVDSDKDRAISYSYLSDISKPSEQQRLHIESTYKDLRVAQAQGLQKVEQKKAFLSPSSSSDQRLPTPPPTYESARELAHCGDKDQSRFHTYARSRKSRNSSSTSRKSSSANHRRRRQGAATAAAAPSR